LPKDGTAVSLLSGLTYEKFQKIQNDAKQMTGKLLLPRFKIDNGGTDLTDALLSLGVPLFDANTAPLTGGLVNENIPVWLSGAMQKAKIEVDEKGTTAAAVTVGVMTGADLPQPTKPFKMICNKPFAFILYGKGGQILFTGVVNQAG
jgi:serpin B